MSTKVLRESKLISEGVDTETAAKWVAEQDEAYTRSPLAKAEREEDKALEVSSIRAKLQNSTEGQMARAASAVEGRESERIPDSEYAGFRKSVASAVADEATDERLAKRERRLLKKAEKFRAKEPRIYGPASPWSWYVDRARAKSDGPVFGKDEAAQRLNRYAQEIQYETRQGSKEGRRAERMLREETRGMAGDRKDLHEQYVEQRTVGSDGGLTAAAAGEVAAFVSPFILESDWAPFRGIARSYSEQCYKEPLPPFGMRVYVPKFATAASASQMTEGGSVSEASPTTALEEAAIQTVTGEVIISQVMSDRGFMGNGSMDSIIARQIHQQIDEGIEKYVLGQIITNGEPVTGQATYKTANLYQDIAKAREVLTDTSGLRLRPTHFFTTSDLYSYATRQVDATTERPVVVPTFAPGFPLVTGADSGPKDQPRPKWSRFTGTVMPGGVLWFTSDAIPTIGTTTRSQLIVSAPEQSVTLLEGEPIVTSFVETLANTLRIVVNVRVYVAAVTRHAAGNAIISSAAYVNTLV
jgi:hypothetical protein